MIICSLPRCGATKYCIDLSKDTGMEFVGELHPMYIDNNSKASVHETNFQPTFTVDTFSHYLYNYEDYIILVNQSPHMLLPLAERVIIRHNMLDAFNSHANFLLRMYPTIKANVLIHIVKTSILDYKGVKAYISKYPKDIIYYEEYFNREGTTTPVLDNHLHGSTIKKAIKELYNG